MAESEANPVPAVLEVEDISVNRGKTPVLKNVAFSSHPGEVLSILGPNGAGKTTLLKAIAGLLPFTGRVTIDGTSVTELPGRVRARKLAFVPQHTLLRSALPVWKVVAQGRYAHLGGLSRPGPGDHAIITQALRKADVEQFSQRHFTSLSFGEQRRVLLARGLCTGAKILCLDEPTASLDIAHALSLHALLRELASEGHCVIVVMHNLDDALQHTDRTLLLKAGEQRYLGPAREVITQGPIEEVYGVRMQLQAGLRFALPPTSDLRPHGQYRQDGGAPR